MTPTIRMLLAGLVPAVCLFMQPGPLPAQEKGLTSDRPVIVALAHHLPFRGPGTGPVSREAAALVFHYTGPLGDADMIQIDSRKLSPHGTRAAVAVLRALRDQGVLSSSRTIAVPDVPAPSAARDFERELWARLVEDLRTAPQKQMRGVGAVRWLRLPQSFLDER